MEIKDNTFYAIKIAYYHHFINILMFLQKQTREYGNGKDLEHYAWDHHRYMTIGDDIFMVGLKGTIEELSQYIIERVELDNPSDNCSDEMLDYIKEIK